MHTIFLYGKPNRKEGFIKIWLKLKTNLKMELREATAKVKQTKRQALYNIRFKSW
jgi:hypothetical protein